MSSYAVSTTTQNTENQSYSFENLMGGNVNAGGNATINGLYGEDMQAFVKGVKDIAVAAATSNSDLAGKSIQQIATGYQSAYSETTGIIQNLKPVLMLGAAALTFIYAYKFLK